MFSFREKLSELRREKQKLVEKIMDQYRVLEPSMQSPVNKAKYCILIYTPVHWATSLLVKLKVDSVFMQHISYTL